MEVQRKDAQAVWQPGTVDRRSFLTRGANVAAGIAASGALLGTSASEVLASTERQRSISIARKANVTLQFAAQFNSSELVYWNQVIADFEAANPNINVALITIQPASWGAYAEKIISIVAGGQPLDIIRIATEGAQLWGAKNLAMPLDSFLKRDAAQMEDYLNDVSPKLMNIFKYKGRQLGLPFDWNNNIIFWNTAVFQKAGVAAPKADWTGDDFIGIAKKVRAAGAWAFNPWPGGTFGIVDWMYAAGGDLYANANFTKANASAPANVQAMQFVQDLIFKYKVAPRPGAPDFPLFEAGRLGMINAGRWPLATFVQAKFSGYDIQYMPKLSPNRKTIFGVGALPIYAKSQHPEEAWKFLKYLASRPVMRNLAALGQGISPRRSVSLDSKIMYPPKNYHIYYDSLAAAETVPNPPQFNEVEDALDAGWTKLLANETTPAAMLKDLDAKMATILTKAF
jgi:ABC-type glycerol-3-phosphate transport system substrate-binding protein